MEGRGEGAEVRQVEESVGVVEPARGLVVGERGLLGGGEGAEPEAGALVGLSDLGHPLAHVLWRTPRSAGRPSPVSGPSSTRACGRSTGVDTGMWNRGFEGGRGIVESRSPLEPDAGDDDPGPGRVPASRRGLWSWARPQG